MNEFCAWSRRATTRDAAATTPFSQTVEPPTSATHSCNVVMRGLPKPLYLSLTMTATWPQYSLGQVATEAVDAEGFGGIWRHVRSRRIDQERLRHVFSELPRMAEHDLLRIGELAECALQGMVKQMSAEMLERELRIQNFPQVRAALRILAQERCWHITQAEMARRVHASVAYFSRLFKRVMGRTFSDYLTGLRMREAQNLLHQTRLSVNDIGQRLGYTRPSYFTRRLDASPA